jgi:hypothetical protein
MEQEQFDMALNYEDLAEYIYEQLIDLGYAPDSDEVLDIADFMMDFIIMLLSSGGVELYIMTEGEDE